MITILLSDDTRVLVDAYKAKDKEYPEANFVLWPEITNGGHAASQSSLVNATDIWVRHHEDLFIVTHSEILVTAFRVAVKEQRLAPAQLEILWYPSENPNNVRTILVDSDGRYPENPAGMFDTMEMLLAKLL